METGNQLHISCHELRAEVGARRSLCTHSGLLHAGVDVSGELTPVVLEPPIRHFGWIGLGTKGPLYSMTSVVAVLHGTIKAFLLLVEGDGFCIASGMRFASARSMSRTLHKPPRFNRLSGTRLLGTKDGHSWGSQAPAPRPRPSK